MYLRINYIATQLCKDTLSNPANLAFDKCHLVFDSVPNHYKIQ